MSRPRSHFARFQLVEYLHALAMTALAVVFIALAVPVLAARLVARQTRVATRLLRVVQWRR